MTSRDPLTPKVESSQGDSMESFSYREKYIRHTRWCHKYKNRFILHVQKSGFLERSFSLSTTLGFLAVLDIAGHLFFLDIPSFDFSGKLSKLLSFWLLLFCLFCYLFFFVLIQHRFFYCALSVFQQQISPILFHFLS